MKYLVLSLLILTACAPTQQSINPQVVQLGATLTHMQTISADVPTIAPGFKISWGPCPATDSVLWYNIYRGGVDIVNQLNTNALMLIGTTFYPTFVDTLILSSVRYAYSITAHNRYGDSGFSPVVSGAWVSLGPSEIETKRLSLYDSVWTSRDLLVLEIPKNAPAQWIWQRTPECVTWRNYLDMNSDCRVNLTDLGYWIDTYNKAGCDTAEIKH